MPAIITEQENGYLNHDKIPLQVINTAVNKELVNTVGEHRDKSP